MLRVTAAFVAISFSALAQDWTNCGPNVGQVSPSYGCSASTLAQNAIAPDVLPPLTGKESGDVKSGFRETKTGSGYLVPNSKLQEYSWSTSCSVVSRHLKCCQGG